MAKALKVVSSNQAFTPSKSEKNCRQCHFGILNSTKMINQYIHVFVQLVASRRAFGHGVGYSHVGCHVELVKIAQNP